MYFDTLTTIFSVVQKKTMFFFLWSLQYERKKNAVNSVNINFFRISICFSLLFKTIFMYFDTLTTIFSVVQKKTMFFFLQSLQYERKKNAVNSVNINFFLISICFSLLFKTIFMYFDTLTTIFSVVQKKTMFFFLQSLQYERKKNAVNSVNINFFFLFRFAFHCYLRQSLCILIL